MIGELKYLFNEYKCCLLSFFLFVSRFFLVGVKRGRKVLYLFIIGSKRNL